MDVDASGFLNQIKMLKGLFNKNDARMFNGTHDYPMIHQIKSQISNSGKLYDIEIKDDIIRLSPSPK